MKQIGDAGGESAARARTVKDHDAWAHHQADLTMGTVARRIGRQSQPKCGQPQPSEKSEVLRAQNHARVGLLKGQERHWRESRTLASTSSHCCGRSQTLGHLGPKGQPLEHELLISLEWSFLLEYAPLATG